MQTWVRESFYLPPPPKGASGDTWAAWIAADDKAASAAKRKHTCAQVHGEIPDTPTATVRVGGVWRTVALVGWAGDAESGTATREGVATASQETDLARARQACDTSTRGTKSSSRSARRRAAKRAKRAGRF